MIERDSKTAPLSELHEVASQSSFLRSVRETSGL